MLPSLSQTIVLEGVSKAQILQEPSPDNGGVMRIRVPFYVGGSVARSPGIQEKLYWDPDKLNGIIAEGTKEINEARQPLTVYPRHSHATQGDHLPVGKIVGLDRNGTIGYATMEIATGTAAGKDVAALIQANMLNAVSLRTSRYELEKVKVNDEEMVSPTIKLDGVDFAPDSPAMPTYGIEVLAEAKVEQITELKEDKVADVEKTISLETVKGYPAIVAEIEAPLRSKLSDAEKKVETLTAENTKAKADMETLTAKVTTLESEKSEREKTDFIREISTKLPEPEKAFTALMEYCKDAKTKDEVAARAMPVILEGLDKLKPIETKTTEQTLMEKLFPGNGSGQPNLQQEVKYDGLVVDGLPMPK